MSIFSKFKKNKSIDIQTEPLTIYQPVEGTVIPLKDLNDGVFSEGILGDGCAIKPIDQIVYAPFDGVISTIADTYHAIGLTSKDGVECLIHVGLDTVEMQGNGFNVFVKDGAKIKAGQPLMEFSINKIQAANFPTDVVVVVTNTFDYDSVNILNSVSQTPLTPLIKVIEKG